MLAAPHRASRLAHMANLETLTSPLAPKLDKATARNIAAKAVASDSFQEALNFLYDIQLSPNADEQGKKNASLIVNEISAILYKN